MVTSWQGQGAYGKFAPTKWVIYMYVHVCEMQSFFFLILVMEWLEYFLAIRAWWLQGKNKK